MNRKLKQFSLKAISALLLVVGLLALTGCQTSDGGSDSGNSSLPSHQHHH
ncbi:MAG: hypothetical protein KIS67_08745 [Verrucomicrobiae bacterium]|nr:hypothetical protein [Verrucomicrobiae bacterium]